MSSLRETILENRIRAAKFAYYHKTPTMTDEAYDALETALKQLNPANPVLAETGAPANLNSPWPTARHSVPMTSLSKSLNMQEFAEWWNAQAVSEAYLSEKQDGLSLSLVYEAGSLVQAIVRGDGQSGDDITPNAVKIQGVKIILPVCFTGIVYGEIRLRKSGLAKARFVRPDKAYANCRNTASGLAREKDGELCGLLDFVAYNLIGEDSCKTEESEFHYLQVLGFQVSPGQVVRSVREVEFIYREYQAGRRSALDYDIDGLVITKNLVTTQDEAGFNAEGKPLAAQALKFPPRVVKTVIRNIQWPVGDSGRLSPVADVDPVECDGATIRHINLFNLDFILLHEVTIGSEVEVERAGDIIPSLVRVLKQGLPFWKK